MGTVMNHSIVFEDIIQRAEKLIQQGQTMDLIIAQDIIGLNNGVFLIRNTEYVFV